MARTAGGKVVEIRPMEQEHVDACADTFEEALGALLRTLGLPPRPDPAAALTDTATRVDHLLATDPDGSWVATGGGGVVAFTQAAQRDDCWVLVHLFVRPGTQSSGVGRMLLDRARQYAADAPIGLIGATADPRAIRTYAQLPGFRTLPTLNASGTVRADRLDGKSTAGVRDGEVGDLVEFEALDRRLRGGTRAPDAEYLCAHDHRLRVLPGRGYSVIGSATIDMLSAEDDDSARVLLTDALLQGEGRSVTVGRMTAEQQWAFPVLVAAGLDLRPWGPFVVRGLDRAPTPYLPSPSLC
jgi:GNAT superfamily N-acetyltransferase